MNVTESKAGSFFAMSYEQDGLEARIPGRCARNTIIFSKKRTVFRKRSCRKTVSFEEQIKSKDKYPSIFPRQMKVLVHIILEIFFVTRAVFKIGEITQILPSFSWKKNIWWIINLEYPKLSCDDSHEYTGGNGEND